MSVRRLRAVVAVAVAAGFFAAGRPMKAHLLLVAAAVVALTLESGAITVPTKPRQP